MFGGGSKAKVDEESESYLESSGTSQEEEGTGEEYDEGEQITNAAEDSLDQLTGNKIERLSFQTNH